MINIQVILIITIKIYISDLSKEEYSHRLKVSTTLYVGNLSFYTNEG